MKHFTRIHAVAALATGLLLAPPAAEAKGRQKDESSRTQQSSKAGESELQGKVKQSGSMTPAGASETNTVVLLETEQGDMIAVDLGRTAELEDVKIKQGLPLTVRGSIVDIQGKPHFLASTIRIGGVDRKVQRDSPQRGAQATGAKATSDKRFSGEIVQMRQVNLKRMDEQHTVAILRTQEGRQLYVDLGPSDALGEAALSKGDRISVIGSGMRTRDGHAVLLANHLTTGGKTFFIEREGRATGDPGDRAEPKPEKKQQKEPQSGDRQ